ncbi:MAG: DUF3786 domain-containing protein [Pseudomonadota bacterium]
MARVDDYINAKKMAVKTLSAVPFKQIAQRAGFTSDADNFFLVRFLDRTYLITYPDFEFKETSADKGDGALEIPLQEQVLILHYMMAETDARPVDKWVAYREIPGASFYFGPFTKRAIDPLKKVFGNHLSGFHAAAAKLAGKPISDGDAGYEFNIFPKVPVRLIVWEGDEEFAPEGNILFDESIGGILPVEDVAWLAGMVVYRLAALSR